MSVVGIDFGNYCCYISVARTGGIETIDNDYSLRATPSFVSFGDKQRIMGVGAKTKMMTNLSRTFFDFKHLIGRKFLDPEIQDELRHLSYTTSEAENGGIMIHVPGNEAPFNSFTPEQIAGMLFTKLKQTVEHVLNTKVKNVVISVPSGFRDCERRGLLQAAEIAGFGVLKIINDMTATALAYGIYKSDLPNVEEKPRVVIFVDCGHVKVEVSACSFIKGKLVVLATKSSFKTGGKYFDDVLARYFAKIFKDTYKIDALSNQRAYLKLLTEVEKLKKQMSASTSKLPINIECFMNDKDVRSEISREIFEQLAEPFFKVIQDTIEECRLAAKLSHSDVYSVEIVGGSTRIPYIKKMIESMFGKAPMTTLNGDEAVSRGCALMCAMLSPTFKVREFSVVDVQPYPIKLAWSLDKQPGEAEVFPLYQQIPSSKMLTLYRKENFSLRAEYCDNTTIFEPLIGVFGISGFESVAQDAENLKVKLKLRVDTNGVFNIVSAWGAQKILEMDPKPMEVDEPSVTENEEPVSMEDASISEQVADGGVKNGDKAPETEPKPAPTAPKSKSIQLSVSSSKIMACTKLDEYIRLESTMTQNDITETNRVCAKNSLEEYVYEVRSGLHGALSPFVLEDQAKAFLNLLQSTEDWLYDEGEDCVKKTYDDKLAELKVIGEPIKNRMMDHGMRPEAINALGHSIQMVCKLVEAYQAGHAEYKHLDKDEMNKVVESINDAQTWLNEKCALVANLKSWEGSPVSANDFLQRRQNFEKSVNPAISKPAPPPPAPPKPTPAAAPTDSDKAPECPVNGPSSNMKVDTATNNMDTE